MAYSILHLSRNNQRTHHQVGYIGGYSSFIGFDKQKGNAVVVLQNAFNWSNYIGIALLMDMAKNDSQREEHSRPL